jgi:hypothetical protein
MDDTGNRAPGFEPGGRRFESCRAHHPSTPADRDADGDDWRTLARLRASVEARSDGEGWHATVPHPHPEAIGALGCRPAFLAIADDPSVALNMVAAEHARACWWITTENSSAEPRDLEVVYNHGELGNEVELVECTPSGPAVTWHAVDGVPWAGAAAAELSALVAWGVAAQTSVYVSIEHTRLGRARVSVTVDLPDRWDALGDPALALHGADLELGQLEVTRRETGEQSFVDLLAHALAELVVLDGLATRRVLEMEVANG